MQYNIIDGNGKNFTDTQLKEIINQKLYRIIELLEFHDCLSIQREYE